FITTPRSFQMAQDYSDFKSQLKTVASKTSKGHTALRTKQELEKSIKPAIEKFLTQETESGFLTEFHVNTNRTSPSNEINGELAVSVGIELNDENKSKVSFHIVCQGGGASLEEFFVPTETKADARMMLSLTKEQANILADVLRENTNEQACQIFNQIDGWLKSVS
ncbi:MAG: hypothetical protein ACRD3W_24990, partial [Terriglobales bacterium]